MTELLVSAPQKGVIGESPMIDFELWTEVHARFRRGQGQRTIARELWLDRQTIRNPSWPKSARGPIAVPCLVPRWSRLIWTISSGVPSTSTAERIPDTEASGAQGYRGGYAMVPLTVRPLRAERDWLAAATRRRLAGKPRSTGARRGRTLTGGGGVRRSLSWCWGIPGGCLVSLPTINA